MESAKQSEEAALQQELQALKKNVTCISIKLQTIMMQLERLEAWKMQMDYEESTRRIWAAQGIK
jgi:hypothetical protein